MSDAPDPKSDLSTELSTESTVVTTEEPSSPSKYELANGPGVQALWHAVLPLVGARAAAADERAGLIRVEEGPDAGEATVYVDIPTEPYDEDAEPPMNRVLALSVKLAHDYRKLGDHYYCIDCETPSSETRH